MVIVCGTDLFAPSLEAARAAAALAARWKEPLELVHVLENAGAETAERRRAIEATLEKEAERLAAELGVEVSARMGTGIPDHELCTAAQGASLLVVGALGRRMSTRWRLGSVAERLAQTATVPLLVVRDARAIEAWTREERALVVVLGLDGGTTSASARRALSELRRRDHCDVIEAHVYDAAAEPRRHDMWSTEEQGEERAVIERGLERHLHARAGELPGRGALRFRAMPAVQGVAETLVALAAEEHADLLVLGSHRRGPIGRRLRGSVSMAVLSLAATNVLCVPHGAFPVALPRPVSVRKVLAATDFSESGNQAVATAYALLPAGGMVTLLHVDVTPVFAMSIPMRILPHDADEAEREARRMLAELVPEQASKDGIRTEIDCTEDFDPARAIVNAAERHDCDLVCVGTHGQGPLSVLLGSVAREVLRRSRRPVLVVPAARA
jgi:nucleotide-binding universal stress UspA family protein